MTRRDWRCRLHQVDIAGPIEWRGDVCCLGRPFVRLNQAIPECLVEQTAQSEITAGMHEVCPVPRSASAAQTIMFFKLVERREIFGCPAVVEKFRELRHLLGAHHEMRSEGPMPLGAFV